jgi:hypothetical protein
MVADASHTDPLIGAISRSTNGRYKTKVRLISRDRLDRRYKASRKFEAVAAGIASDLGGADMLSTVERNLIEAFAGISVHVADLNARMLLGQKIDLAEHSQVVSTMVRVASRIGVRRIPRDVTPTINDIARDIAIEREATDQAEDVAE